MKNTKIIESVSFKIKENVSIDNGKEAMKALSNFVKMQPGFISRKTSTSEQGEFLDLVFWTDLDSAVKASEKAMRDESLAKHFAVIDESSMQFKHFEVFHST